MSPFCKTMSLSANSAAVAAVLARGGGEHEPALGEIVAGENRVERVEHVLGRHVGQEAQAAAIDADERHLARGDVASCVQQRAVAADRDDEVGLGGDLALVDVSRARELARRIGRNGSEDRDAALAQMGEKLAAPAPSRWARRGVPTARPS